ncbi:hypothetical protein BDR06DRAFT_963569, partial [Suillus hirtellus]
DGPTWERRVSLLQGRVLLKHDHNVIEMSLYNQTSGFCTIHYHDIKCMMH